MHRSSSAGIIIIAALAEFGCVRQKVELSDAHRLPSPDDIVMPTPEAAARGADTITEIAMRNVDFHVDDDARFEVRRLSGRIRALDGSHVVSFDDKNAVEIDMASAEVALTPKAMSLILNRYVFGFKGSPIRDLVITTDGDEIEQTGTMHKLIDIPFKMRAQLSVDTSGWIRVHPTKIEICNLDGQKLLKAVGSSLEKMLDLRNGKGVKAEGNDLLIDALASLPPPKIAGRLSAIRVANGKIIQTFGPATSTTVLAPPVDAQNYLYFRGGTIKFGKLYMVKADLLTVDGDPADPFDFYMDYYHTMLVNGYHVTLPNYGLVTYMPDFDDIGTARGRIVAGGMRVGPGQ